MNGTNRKQQWQKVIFFRERIILHIRWICLFEDRLPMIEVPMNMIQTWAIAITIAMADVRIMHIGGTSNIGHSYKVRIEFSPLWLINVSNGH